MKLRKLLFTAISIPLGQKTWWAYKWQKERKQEKELEIKGRMDKLRMQVLEVNDIQEIDHRNEEEFQKRWQYRPVRVKGILDNEQEILI